MPRESSPLPRVGARDGTRDSLRAFKRTPGFTKILPFVKLDPRTRQRNEEARRAFEPMLADNNSAPSAPHVAVTKSVSTSPDAERPPMGRKVNRCERSGLSCRTVALSPPPASVCLPMDEPDPCLGSDP